MNLLEGTSMLLGQFPVTFLDTQLKGIEFG